MEDETVTRQVVRVYSFQAEERLPAESEAHVLARVLSDKEPSLENITEPWRRFFEPWESDEHESDPITNVLSVEAAKLQEQWFLFQKFIPKEEQIDVRNSEPTIDGVIKMVATVSKAWQAKREKGKRGKATGLFHRLCGTLDAHSSMLEVVPKGNEYASLFAGTIISIIRASVNHEHIAEDLASALCAISENVAECEVELELFKTEAMMRAVADLYAHIFLFLSDTLGWYLRKRRKRLVDSFNEKFFDHFETEIDNIKRKSESIRRKAAQNMAAEQRVTRLTVEETGRDLRLGLQGIMREQAETKYAAQQMRTQMQRERAEWQEEKKHLASLHANLLTFLTDAVQSHGLQELSLLRPSIAGAPNTVQRVLPGLDIASITREKVMLNSACLEDFFHRDRVRLPCDHFAPVKVNPEALARLAEWSTATDSDVLCLAGPDIETDELENSMTMLAARFVDFAARSNVPVMSYFCELRRGQKNRPGNTAEMQGAIELVYALIRQTIELLPLELKENDSDLSGERFQQLDGSAASLGDAIALLNELCKQLPGKVFCVIDGLQWLDDKSTDTFLARFAHQLREAGMKVLFTTTGQSRALLDCLSRGELSLYDGPENRSGGAPWELDDVVEF